MRYKSLSSYILFFSGISLLSFGIILAVKADYGITVATSTPYVLSKIMDAVSFGTLNSLIQGITFLLLVLLMRKIKLKYLLSFATAVLFGYTLDLFGYLFRDIYLTKHFYRILFFVFSVLFIVLGLVFMIKSSFPLLPFDNFCREISAKFGVGFGRFKIFFDLTLLATSTTMSLVYFKRLNGVHIGTIISALTIGPCIGLVLNVVEKHRLFGTPHPEKRETTVLDDD